MDGRQVLNTVDPIVDQQAIEAAKVDAQQRAAALQREEDARRVQDAAVVAGYNRAPDRPAIDDKITDPNADQLRADVPQTPFTTVGLDETALRTLETAGVSLSPSTERHIAKVNAERAFQREASLNTGGVYVAPDETQETRTASSIQSAQPNESNKPDQPSLPNEPNAPEQSGATTAGEFQNVGNAPEGYEGKTVKELRATADERQVEVKSDAKKAEIIAALEEHDAR